MSISGISVRSGERKRSKMRSFFNGSKVVISSA